MFAALLDTCVLWPSLQRDFLLSLAIEGMYRPVWSSAILDELEYHEATKLISRGEARNDAARRAEELVRRMRSAFDDAEASGWQPFDGTYRLPDPDDEHVVAAAEVAAADAIVTNNTKDFPARLIPAGIQVLQPNRFAADIVALDPIPARVAVAAMASRSGRLGPRVTEHEILDILAKRYQMTSAADIIRQVG